MIDDIVTALYRHYDAAGKLLYVGISLSAVTRLQQHRDRSAWYKDIRRITVEWLESREAAEAAERRAILMERPAHNKQHVKVARERQRAPVGLSLVSLIITKVDYEWLQQAAEKAALPEDEIIRLIAVGVIPFRTRTAFNKNRVPAYIKELRGYGITVAET